MRHSLRLRLTVACLALLTLGLVAAGIVTYSLVESFLIQRVDQQLSDRADSAGRFFGPRSNNNLGGGRGPTSCRARGRASCGTR